MKNTLLKLIAILLLNFQGLIAQTPNWAEHIAPIIYKNCVTCHHNGGLAPMPLITYNQADSNATGIDYYVSNKLMPPWPPNPDYKRFAHERLLSSKDIHLIKNWVKNGSPSGNLSLAPTPPIFNSNSQIGTPDLVVKIPTYTSTAKTADLYRCFVMPTNLTAQKFATAVEVIPGNSAIVHHALVYYDTTNVCDKLDAADPGPGYTNFGGVGSSTARLIGIWVPGSEPLQFPTGFGMRLPIGAKIIVQIHYPKGSDGLSDSTKINLKLSTTKLRQLGMDPALNHWGQMTNGPLVIPANVVKSFHQEFKLPIDISLLSVGPHMHLLGKSMKVWGTLINGDTLPLIDIPEWDFHWQGVYSFRNILKIPKGTKLESEAVFDNTTNNHENPNNPPKVVVAGEATDNEMMLCYFLYTYYFPGDENLVIDNTPLVELYTNTKVEPFARNVKAFTLFPNPSNKEWITISVSDGMERELPIQLFTTKGELVFKTILSVPQTQFDIGFLPKGSYVMKVGDKTKLFIKE